MGGGFRYKADKCDDMCMKPYSLFSPLLQTENATREPRLTQCVVDSFLVRRVRQWKSVEDIEQDVCSICFKTIPKGKERGGTLRGNYFISQLWALLAPCLHMHVTQEKGIIRGREDEERPGEMNRRGFLTPWRYKVGRGWLMFIKAAAMRSLCFHPPTSVFWLYSSFWEEIKKKHIEAPFFLTICTSFVLWRNRIRENPLFWVAKTFLPLLKIGFISTFFERETYYIAIWHIL